MASSSEPGSTLFVKIERLRRLHRADEFVITVRRGDDGTFGLGLSEDNEIIHFPHDVNNGPLQIGDQVQCVGGVPLVRERLAALLLAHFPDEVEVQLRISRAASPVKFVQPGEVFGSLQLRDERGAEIDEWSSETWALRTDVVWGTFWTLALLPGTHDAWLGVHMSNLFSDPLIGGVEIQLDALKSEELDTRWYSLRRAGRAYRGCRTIEGEVLLTTRRFQSAVSVSPDRAAYLDESDESSDDDLVVDHSTVALAPIEEPLDLRPSRAGRG